MDKELTARQRTILLATAAGYKGKEIAAALQVGEMTIVRERRKAQTRLRELLS